MDFHRWAVLSTLVRWVLCVQWWASVTVYSCDIEGEWSVEDNCVLNIHKTAVDCLCVTNVCHIQYVCCHKGWH